MEIKECSMACPAHLTCNACSVRRGFEAHPINVYMRVLELYTFSMLGSTGVELFI